MFKRQCKGKELQKVATSKLDTDSMYWLAIKYDGNYIQIHKNKNKVTLLTSGNKQFTHAQLERWAKKLPFSNIILEAEFLGKSKGKKGDRIYASTGSARAAFNNNNSYGNTTDDWRVFDIVSNKPYVVRMEQLRKIDKSVDLYFLSFENCLIKANELRKADWEGAIITKSSHMQLEGKRVNDRIKLKKRPTTELLCVEVLEGKGKYSGLIGSLKLIDKERNLEVFVGSGLSDEDRKRPPYCFIGRSIEISYEQILRTYIQPTYEGIRDEIK